MQSEELLSILIQLSKADDHFDAFEFTYILNVGEELGLSQAHIENLIKEEPKSQIRIPKTEEERMTVLYYMLFLMKIDTNVSDKEKKLVHHYGFKLGFSHAMIDDFISLVEKYEKSRVPVEDMLAVIRKYKN